MSEQATHLDAETYAYLRTLASRIHARQGGRSATIQPTALLHEAWLKVSVSSCEYNDGQHFLAVAARAMRQILVDRARARGSKKRGGEFRQVTLTGLGVEADNVLDVVDLDTALSELEAVDERAARVAVLRTFGGLTAPEAADAMGMSLRSLQRSWRFARVFLAQKLQD
jgi:RNA polymerase sigma factor (TIGR02999 family)